MIIGFCKYNVVALAVLLSLSYLAPTQCRQLYMLILLFTTHAKENRPKLIGIPGLFSIVVRLNKPLNLLYLLCNDNFNLCVTRQLVGGVVD